MENFYQLRAEKQEEIIAAAYKIFSQNPYKRAAIQEIAQAAGLSKGMIFYYFGSKKNLYLFLVDKSGELLRQVMKQSFDESINDFFERLIMITEIKVSLITHQPDLLTFLKNVYYEKDEEVVNEIRATIAQGLSNSWQTITAGADVSRFRDPQAPELLAKLLTWAGEGAVNDWYEGDDLQARMQEYIRSIRLLKASFYQEPERKRE